MSDEIVGLSELIGSWKGRIKDEVMKWASEPYRESEKRITASLASQPHIVLDLEKSEDGSIRDLLTGNTIDALG